MKQECIPVGSNWLLIDHMLESASWGGLVVRGDVCSRGCLVPGGCLLWGVSDWGGVCSGGGLVLGGVCSGECLVPGGCLLWGVSALGGLVLGVSAPRVSGPEGCLV